MPLQSQTPYLQPTQPTQRYQAPVEHVRPASDSDIDLAGRRLIGDYADSIRSSNSDLDELDEKEKGILIIRSHGVPKRIYELLEEQGLECVDATCPFVKKIHRIVEEESKKGRGEINAAKEERAFL